MYKSPLHILDGFELNLSEGLDAAALLRLRKKLLAEFDLSNATTIDIKGKQYSKDEVIKTIDVLLGNPQMPVHLFIFENKKLLDFLENDNSTVRPVDVKAILIPDEIKAMLSPLLLDRFVFNMRKAFHSKNFGITGALFAFAPDFSEEEKALFHEEINKNIVNLQEHVQVVRHNGFQNALKELDYLKKNTLAVFLNALPHEFIDSINSLVVEIINMMVSYQKIQRHDKALLYYISSNLLKIGCDDELMRLVKSNHKAFTQNYEGVSSSGGSGSSVGRLIYIVIILVVFVVRLSTCNRNSSNDIRFDKSYQDIINSIQNSKSGYEEFKEYRKHILLEEGFKSINANNSYAIQLDSAISGNNPYLYILNRVSDFDYMDTTYKRIIINNRSSHDLIITVFDDANAKGYFFFKNKSDTISFYEGQKFCLYFGDTLSAIKKGSAKENYTFIKSWYEVYFKQTDSLSKEVFDLDFRVVTVDDLPKKNKKKKKTLDVVEFTDKFLISRRIETKKTIFKIDNDDIGLQDTLNQK